MFNEPNAGISVAQLLAIKSFVIGPSMKVNGVPVAGRMSDPTLQLVNANGVVIAENDNWQATQSLEIAATGLAPEEAAESAILAVLPQGPATALLRGKGETTGIAVLETYRVGN